MTDKTHYVGMENSGNDNSAYKHEVTLALIEPDMFSTVLLPESLGKIVVKGLAYQYIDVHMSSEGFILHDAD